MTDLVPPPPRVSPDGRFYLRAGEWVPLPAVASGSQVAYATARGVMYVLATLSLCLGVFPIVLFVAVTSVQGLVPAPLAAPAMIATAVVLVGALFCLVRRMRP